MSKAIAQKLIEAGDLYAANYDATGHSHYEAFKQLAQEVEVNINAYEFERNKYIANYADNMKRESLWRELDQAWQEYQRSYDSSSFYPLGGKVGQLRKQLGLE
jgi:hypothetical protein